MGTMTTSDDTASTSCGATDADGGTALPHDPADAERPGDIGRRVAERRRELGMDRQELARRAEVAVGYVVHIETAPAVVTAGSLLRLADALDTTADELLGADVDAPRGRGSAPARPRLDVLSVEECQRLVGEAGIGRLVLVDEDGPAALPVNYAVSDGAVLLRTAPGTSVAAVDGQLVGFEVDRMDEAMHRGWSVLCRGRAHVLGTMGDGLPVPDDLPDPWAGGDRTVVVRLDITSTSGRRLRSAG